MAVGRLLVRLGFQPSQAAQAGDPSVSTTVGRLGARLQTAGYALRDEGAGGR